MVRVCAFPGCSNKMKRSTSESFHRIPLQESTWKQWLVVLQLNVDTPVHTLKQKDHRVCSAHFDPDDFVMCTAGFNPRRRMRLKSTAIPKATLLPPEVTVSEDSLYVSEFAAAPQSTPKKSHCVPDLQHRRRADLSSGLRLTLSSPKLPTVRPRTRPSSSGLYLARPASWHASEEHAEKGAAGASDTSVQDLSLSFGEMDFDNPAETSFVPLSDTTPSSPSSGSGSGSTDGWEGRKWLVDEANLMELFRTCSQCGMAITEKRIRTRASQIRIHWTCIKGHTGEWASCVDQRGMGRSNLLVCAAIFFSGATYSDIAEWAELINMPLPSKTLFYAIQSKYLIPVVNHAYKGHQQKIIERITQLSASGTKLELCGDARCDSPGYSSKYSTYTFQDDATKEIVHFELVQVTEASSSVAMETVGFQRGLNHLLYLGADIGVMTTDRSPSIRKVMRESYANIRHEYDPWHVNKSLKKKLIMISNKKDFRALQPWVRSISNHLYWSCSSSHGDEEECVRRRSSILHHICGIHRWEENGMEYTCTHPPLTEEDQEKKRWLEHDSSAFRALKELVLEKTLLRDLRQMALFKHTGSLEVFHNVTLKYAPKRLHFTYDSMRARTELAIIDYNMNVGRQQKTTLEGKPQYKYMYTKTTQQWVAKPLYEATSQLFRQDLMEDVLKMREEKSLEPWPRPPPRPRRLLENIAPLPRPDTSKLVAQRLSRFKQL